MRAGDFVRTAALSNLQFPARSIMHNYKLFLPAMLILIISSVCTAGSGTSALTFLRIAPSARAASMGETFTAVADDVNASYWNPAGTANLETMQLSFMHMFYWDSSSYEYLAFAYPLNDKLKLGAHLACLNYGTIDKTLAGNSTVVGSFSPFDLVLAATAAYKLSGTLQAGVNIKFVTQTIDTDSVSILAFDGGLLYEIPSLLEAVGGRDFVIGAALSNLGGTVNGDSLPLTLRGGVSAKFGIQSENDLLLAATACYPFDSGALSENLGAEFSPEKEFVIRAGCKFGYDAGSFTAGLGYRGAIYGAFNFAVDYAYAPSGNLGDTHRISLGLTFDRENIARKSGSGAKTATKH